MTTCPTCRRANGEHDTRCRAARTGRSYAPDSEGSATGAVEIDIDDAGIAGLRIIAMHDAKDLAGTAAVDLPLLRGLLEEINARRANDAGGREIVAALAALSERLGRVEDLLRLAAGADGEG